MGYKKTKNKKDASADIDHLNKIMSEAMNNEKDFIKSIVYNIAKGLGDSVFSKSIKKIEFEYITDSSKVRAEISMNPFIIGTVAVSEPTDKPKKEKK